MSGLLIATLVLGAFGLGIYAIGALLDSKGSSRTQTRRDHHSQKNHLSMARWLDLTVNDDMIRPMIPEDRVEAARKLLAEFYKEGV